MSAAAMGELLLVLLGGVGGYVVGRWMSDTGRGRHDARRAWRGRRDYRRK
jgi:hypothetical protein